MSTPDVSSQSETKKVALLTLHRVKNYGSVLQTLATQELLKGLGWNVEVTDYWRPDLTDSIDEIAERMGWGSPVRRRVYRLVWGRWATRNRDVFTGFLNAEVTLSPRSYVGYEELKTDPPVADAYVVGSDQVWNDDYNVGGSEPFFLAHAPSGAPRVAFASSFGKPELNDAERDLVRAHLNRFTAVSVREMSAVGLLAAHGVEATPVADPTLAVSPDLWARVAGSPVVSDPYVLVYRLNASAEFSRVVKSVAASLGVPAKRIALKTRRKSNATRVVQPSVYEFVSLFRQATHVVTDSFHGTVFSLVFRRPFTVVLPPKYGERLRSILSIVGLEDRIVAAGAPPRLDDINWEPVDISLREYRESTHAFLARAMSNAFDTHPRGSDGSRR